MDGNNPLQALLSGAVPAATVLGSVHDLPFLDLVARWQERLIWPDDALRIAAGVDPGYLADAELLARAREYERYKSALWESNGIDMPDLVSRTVKLLQDNPSVRGVVERRFEAVIVDEVQDVNVAEGALIEILAGGSRNLWVVGDPDQELYSWRGAEIDYVLKMPERHPETRVIALEENYRSVPAVVAAANALIRHNRNRFETSLHPIRPAANLPEPLGRALSHPDPTRPVRQEAIEVVAYDSDIAEALQTARMIRGLLDVGVPAAGIAVGTRAMSRTYFLQLALRASGVAVNLVGGREEAAREPPARAIEGVLRIARFGSGDGQAVPLLAGAKSSQALAASAMTLHKEGLAQAPERWRELCRRAAQLVGLEGPAQRRTADQNTEWIVKAQAAADAAAESGTFDRWMAMLAAAKPPVAACVTIATIHGLKGLEYSHMFLPGWEEDHLPLGRALANEEERRAAYVGLTRARDSLTVSWARTRAATGRDCRASPYIDESFGSVPDVRWSVVTEPKRSTPPPPYADPVAAAPAVAAPVPRAYLGLRKAGATVWDVAAVDGGGTTVLDVVVFHGGNFLAAAEAIAAGVDPAQLQTAPSWPVVARRLAGALRGWDVLATDAEDLTHLLASTLGCAATIADVTRAAGFRSLVSVPVTLSVPVLRALDVARAVRAEGDRSAA